MTVIFSYCGNVHTTTGSLTYINIGYIKNVQDMHNTGKENIYKVRKKLYFCNKK